MSDHRHRLRPAPLIPAFALAFAALLAGCQSPTVHEVHRIALDSMPPPHAMTDDHGLDAWGLADAAQRVQQRVRARNARAVHSAGEARELHVVGSTARAVHPIATVSAALRPVPGSSERSLVAAR